MTNKPAEQRFLQGLALAFKLTPRLTLVGFRRLDDMEISQKQHKMRAGSNHVHLCY